LEHDDVRPTGQSFPVVGIGASAGGLLALEQFLSHVPSAIGMAPDATPGLRTAPDRLQTLLDNAKSLGLEDGVS
jgi:chemotaxis response regulator CheB